MPCWVLEALVNAVLCLDADDDVEQELRALTPEEAARLRSQMEDLLKRSDEARAVSASNEEAMRYGREMWARCEALTAGTFHHPHCSTSSPLPCACFTTGCPPGICYSGCRPLSVLLACALMLLCHVHGISSPSTPVASEGAQHVSGILDAAL